MLTAWAAFALAALFAAQAGAQGAPPAPPLVMTLERVLELAEANSPRLRLAQAQSESAQASVVVARQYPNPEAELFAGRMRPRIPGAPDGPAGSIGIAQPIDLPSFREPRIRAAEAGAQSGRFALDDARLALRAEVRQAWLDLVRRRAELSLYLDNQSLLEQIRGRIEARVKVGEAARLELTRAEAEASAAAAASNAARLRVAQARGALRLLAGGALPESFEFSADIGKPLVDPVEAEGAERERLRADMLARHPLLAQARAELARSQSRLESERALRTPAPTLRAGVDQDPETRQLRIGIGIPIPLWNQRQGQVAEALAGTQQAAALLAQRELELGAALDAALNRRATAAQQIAAYEGGLLRQAEAALRVAEAAYRFGERGFIEVLDAQRVLRTVRLEFLDARWELQSALIEIARLRATDLKENRS